MRSHTFPLALAISCSALSTTAHAPTFIFNTPTGGATSTLATAA